MVWAIEVLSVPASTHNQQHALLYSFFAVSRREMKIRPDPAAHLLWKPLRIDLRIRTRRQIVPFEIRPRVAPKTALALHRWVDSSGARHGVADQHAESLPTINFTRRFFENEFNSRV